MPIKRCGIIKNKKFDEWMNFKTYFVSINIDFFYLTDSINAVTAADVDVAL